MTKLECPWCDRIFPLMEGHEILLLKGEWAIICDSCYDIMENRTGEIDQEYWT